MFCLIGQVLVDVTIASGNDANKLRFGGVMHAARAMWALDADYMIAYAAPDYLVAQIDYFARSLSAKASIRIADVTGSPNVILIPEPTEAGSQGYELLLREEQRSKLRLDDLIKIANNKQITDVLIFPGGYPLDDVLLLFAKSKAKIHIDAAYDVTNLNRLSSLGRKFDTFFISTSSQLFREKYRSNPSKLETEVLKRTANTVILKENRGGSRLKTANGERHAIGAQSGPIQHSVGVGDCYDVGFVVLRAKNTNKVAMGYSSLLAARYAATTYPDDFKREVRRLRRLKNVLSLDAVRVPWEMRPTINIYIAAPDFNYNDRAHIDAVTNALRYHNFRARRPVLENGQVSESDDRAKRRKIFDRDMQLLSDCPILVAVLTDYDPGTFIEIGMAIALKKPVIVYDPFKLAKNLVLQESPDVITDKLDNVISAVFRFASTILRKLP